MGNKTRNGLCPLFKNKMMPINVPEYITKQNDHLLPNFKRLTEAEMKKSTSPQKEKCIGMELFDWELSDRVDDTPASAGSET